MSWRPKAQVLAPIKELGDRCCLYSPSCREGFFSEIRRAGGHTKGAESLAAPPPAFNRRVYRPLGLSSRPALSLPCLPLPAPSLVAWHSLGLAAWLLPSWAGRLPSPLPPSGVLLRCWEVLLRSWEVLLRSSTDQPLLPYPLSSAVGPLPKVLPAGRP